ncbi:MAG: chaperone modulator CbpM [Bacteroidetes bacterium]|nr:chaperone modulator CbpM [Bacteroidota bacterium]
MNNDDLIPVEKLCVNYNIEFSFLDSLNAIGLVEFVTVEEINFIEKENLSELERMIRLHSDLGINIEGIEAIIHLLRRVDALQHEIAALKNKFGETPE